MSTTTLRYHNSTFLFLPKRRNRKITDLIQQVRLRTSRRRVKQSIRTLFTS